MEMHPEFLKAYLAEFERIFGPGKFMGYDELWEPFYSLLAYDFAAMYIMASPRRKEKRWKV